MPINLGTITEALKYGGELIFNKIAPQLGHFSVNAQNVANKLGIPEKLSERALNTVLNAIQKKSHNFMESQKGYAQIITDMSQYPTQERRNRPPMKSNYPTTPYDQFFNPIYSKSIQSYTTQQPTPNSAFGLGTLGSTPSFGMNSRDLSPAYIGGKDELAETSSIFRDTGKRLPMSLLMPGKQGVNIKRPPSYKKIMNAPVISKKQAIRRKVNDRLRLLGKPEVNFSLVI